MNKTIIASLLTGLGLLLVQTSSFAAATWTSASGAQYVPDQVLVKFKPGVGAAARSQIVQTHGAKTMQAVGKQSKLVLANLAPGQSVEQAVKAYANDPNVEYAQPNYIYHALAIPTDSQYGQLWAAKNTGQTISSGTYSPNFGTAGADMNLESAWDIQTDCNSVVVAVVDSGINYNSQDLSANMWTGNAKHGENFAADGFAGDPMDLYGHGTHVAGIIAAAANSVGGVGVCWNAQLMAVRVLEAAGYGYTSSIVAGINYAVANGAKVINMSLGGSNYDAAMNTAITNALNNNVLVVVSAGNSGSNNDAAGSEVYPCNYTQANLICVAALDQNYALAYFSNSGVTSVDVGAPGTNIYSTWAGTNATMTDFSSLTTPTGWTTSSTTATGWGATTGWIQDPATGWGTSLYAAGTDDRVYKTFNLSGVSATLDVDIAINVRSLDYLWVYSMPTAGDPFAGGGQYVWGITNVASGMTAPRLHVDISSCIGATCSVGFRLTSAAGSAGDIGSRFTNFAITTLTLDNVSYNTINGTSMASPEAAGIAALVWAHNPSFTYADVAGAVKNGGDSIPALSGITTTGRAVDALGSLTYINPPTGIAVTVH